MMMTCQHVKGRHFNAIRLKWNIFGSVKGTFRTTGFFSLFFSFFFLFLNLILMHHCGSNCYIVLGVCAINHQTIAYTIVYLTLYVDS